MVSFQQKESYRCSKCVPGGNESDRNCGLRTGKLEKCGKSLGKGWVRSEDYGNTTGLDNCQWCYPAWIDPILQFARSGRPFLGICLGMQVLFEVGEEHGEHAGLGLLEGRVVKFPPGGKIPHMGWNTVSLTRNSRLLEGIPNESYFYFVHSFYAAPRDVQDILATSDYGVVFPAVVGKDNVWGAQFHPEKSSPWGLQLLTNFGKLVNEYAALSSN
jgi:imidazole glycerol-phosphate synthase subunit HisH